MVQNEVRPNICRKYYALYRHQEHTTLSSTTLVDNKEACSDSFGYIEEKSEIYKENAILIKLKNGSFVDLDNLNSFIDHLSIKQRSTRNGFYLGGIILSSCAHCMGCFFVDYKSLVPYYDNEKNHQT